MPIDITQKSKELKLLVAKYDTPLFIGEVSFLMHNISFENPTHSLYGLSSPERQLMYLCGLNVTSAINEEEPLIPQFSDEEWEQIKALLIEIEEGYLEAFHPEEGQEIDEEWIDHRQIAMPAFLSYFNQGNLNYEEQDIERVYAYYKPFNDKIKAHFGLDVSDFVDIYNFIDSKPNQFLDDNINPKPNQQSYDEWANEMADKKIMPFDWHKHMPDHLSKVNEFVYDKGNLNRFTKQELVDNFGEDKATAFLSTFTCERAETNFLYYTEPNIIYQKPIFRIDDDTYQAVNMHHIIKAVYLNLFNFCKGEKFYKHRGNELEDKIETIFQKFFNGKATVYKGFFTQDKHEQDLLFLVNGSAFIIEAKSSKKDEPRRDPDMAYPLIVSNFEEIIQKGYDQAYRIKSKFISKEILKIYRDQELKHHITDIRTKSYANAFSIVVTLERFSALQTDLSWLLEVWEDDKFPWSVCIDDLEVFLLALTKENKKSYDFVQFLKFREDLHGRLSCGDELEIAGLFLNEKARKQILATDKPIGTTPDDANEFDRLYQGGLGFENEKNIHTKSDKNRFIIGGL